MTDLDRINTPTRPTPERPASLAEWIDNALVSADEQRADLAEQGDLEGLALGLVDLRSVLSKLQTFVGLVDADVSKLNRANGGRTELPGLGVLETHRRSTRTRWESDRLYGRLVDSIAAIAVLDPETGEITGQDAVARMSDLLREHLAACLPLTASMGWRTTGLKAAGIDPSQWREQERGPDTTRIITSDGTK